MKTAIILVTYNHYKLTQACLKCLAELPQERFVVAVVDNCSSDNTVEKIKQEFSWVKLFTLKQNAGFGRANNFAINKFKRQVDFDSICLLNNDALLEKSSIEKLQQHLEQINDECILVPRTLNIDGTEQINYFTKISSLDFLKNAFRNEISATKFLQGTPKLIGQNLSETYRASAVCWMLKRSSWERLCGFDERIFMYYEDQDFAWRARQKKIRFFIANDCTITHLGGGSAKNSLSRAQQNDNSQEYVFKKLFGLKGKMLSRTCRILRSGFRILASIPQCYKKESRAYAMLHFKLLINAL